jgi:hypothetical protein
MGCSLEKGLRPPVAIRQFHLEGFTNKASMLSPPNEFINMRTFRVICLAGALFGAVCAAEAALDTAKIDEITGLKGR